MYRALRARRRRIELEYDVLPVYLAENLSSPCLFGVFRPAIYLTPAALETPERARMVLLHEETALPPRRPPLGAAALRTAVRILV